MTIFVPRATNRYGTREDFYEQTQMKTRNPGGGGPDPPDPPDPPPFQDDLLGEVPDFIFQGRTYQWKHFPASILYPVYPDDPSDNRYDIRPYGRYGYRCAIQDMTMTIPFWHEDGFPDDARYFGLVMSREANSGGQVDNFVKTGFNTQTGEIEELFRGTPTATGGQLFFLGPQVEPKATFATNGIRIKYFRFIPTPGLNGLQQFQLLIQQSVNSVWHMHSICMYYPADVTWYQKNSTDNATPRFFRLADADSINWNFQWAGGSTLQNPIETMEYSDDKDNMHLYVQPRPPVNNEVVLQDFIPTGLQILYRWPIIISQMGSGFSEMVDSDGTSQSNPPGTLPARFDAQNDILQRGPLWCSEQTAYWRLRCTNGTGMIASAIQYIGSKSQGDGAQSDRNLENYGKLPYPNSTWQQGVGAVDPLNFNGSKLISIWDPAVQQWIPQ